MKDGREDQQRDNQKDQVVHREEILEITEGQGNSRTVVQSRCFKKRCDVVLPQLTRRPSALNSGWGSGFSSTAAGPVELKLCEVFFMALR